MSNPFLKALEKKAKPKMIGNQMPDILKETPRQFEMKKTELMKGASLQPGDKISARIHGRVASMHDDGRMMLHIEKATHEADGPASMHDASEKETDKHISDGKNYDVTKNPRQGD